MVRSRRGQTRDPVRPRGPQEELQRLLKDDVCLSVKLQERQLTGASTRRGAILVWEAGVAALLPGATLLGLYCSPSV